MYRENAKFWGGGVGQRMGMGGRGGGGWAVGLVDHTFTSTYAHKEAHKHTDTHTVWDLVCLCSISNAASSHCSSIRALITLSKGTTGLPEFPLLSMSSASRAGDFQKDVSTNVSEANFIHTI